MKNEEKVLERGLEGYTDNCECIKPKTGLIQQALEKYPMIDMEHSFVVGDSMCDMQLAESVGVRAYGINIDYCYDKFTRIKDLGELKCLPL